MSKRRTQQPHFPLVVVLLTVPPLLEALMVGHFGQEERSSAAWNTSFCFLHASGLPVSHVFSRQHRVLPGMDLSPAPCSICPDCAEHMGPWVLSPALPVCPGTAVGLTLLGMSLGSLETLVADGFEPCRNSGGNTSFRLEFAVMLQNAFAGVIFFFFWLSILFNSYLCILKGGFVFECTKALVVTHLCRACIGRAQEQMHQPVGEPLAAG